MYQKPLFKPQMDSNFYEIVVNIAEKTEELFETHQRAVHDHCQL